MMPALLSVAVLAALALMLVGTIAVVRRRGDRLKGWLLIGAGAVLLANVWLYAAPMPPGVTWPIATGAP